VKLKTDCTAYIISGSTDDFSHDAAAAHALLQSLNEHVGDHTNLSLCIIRRAGDLLEEWGYGDE
jgi:hypothetical protein